MPPKIPMPGLNINNSQEKNKYNTIENLKKQNNTFTAEKAQKVADAIRVFYNEDMVGAFYNSFSGKTDGLTRGVDYVYKKIGDFVDLKRITQKRLNDFWQSRDGVKLNNEIESFFKNNHSVLETDYDRIEAGVITRPIVQRGGWLHYNSNYVKNPSTMEMSQPDGEYGHSKYRIYITPEIKDSFKTFFEVINELNKDPVLQKKGFKAKTLDWLHCKYGVDAYNRIFRQKDKMVFYFRNDEVLNRALYVLQNYAEKNRERFNNNEIFFGQPILDKNNMAIPGIVVTDSSRGQAPNNMPCWRSPMGYESFNDMQVLIIKNAFVGFLNELMEKDIAILEKQSWFKQIKPIYEKLKAISNKPRNDFEKKDLKVIFSDPNGMFFIQGALLVKYPEVAKKFGVIENNTAFRK